MKDRLALERSRDLDVVIFDKTGTLTRGTPTLSGVAVVSGASEEEVLKLEASVEADSEHPLAKAIVSGANRRGANPLQGRNFEAMPGSGASATVNGQTVSVGGPHLLSESQVIVPPELEKAATAWASAGQTVLYVVADGRMIGTVAMEDEIRPESAEAVKELHDLGVRVAMITGDSQAVADHKQSRILLRSGSELMRLQLKCCLLTRHRRLRGSRLGARKWRSPEGKSAELTCRRSATAASNLTLTKIAERHGQRTPVAANASTKRQAEYGAKNGRVKRRRASGGR